MSLSRLIAPGALLLPLAAPPAAGQARSPGPGPEALRRQYPQLRDPRYGLLTPIPENCQVPPIVDLLAGTTPDDLARAAEVRGYRRQIESLCQRYFQDRPQSLREEGIVELEKFTEPAALHAMAQVAPAQAEVARTVILDHLTRQGEAGQGVLAWLVIHEDDDALRQAAMSRLAAPAGAPVRYLLDRALRSDDHEVVSNAAVLAHTLNVIDTIPLLIAAQVAQTPRMQTGDLAWIAVEHQTVYVQSLESVVGNSSGVFIPVPAVLTEGFVLRVLDAVVVIYRAAVHHSLVSMSSYDWGQSTAYLGFDQAAWWDWYNHTYVPYKNEQRIIEEMAEEPG